MILAVNYQKNNMNDTPLFSILIPTWNNLPFLQLCIKSIEKNSTYRHQILIHVNDGSDGTLEWVRSSGYAFSHTPRNVGVCWALNGLRPLVTTNYIVFMNDDMYVCPEWDKYLFNEIKSIGHSSHHSQDNTAHLPVSTQNCTHGLSRSSARSLPFSSFTKLKPLMFYNPCPRCFSICVIHSGITLEVRLIQDFCLKTNRTIFKIAKRIVEVGINRTCVYNLLCCLSQYSLCLKIISIQLDLYTIKHILNHGCVSTDRNTLVESIEIVVIKGQTDRKTFDDESRELITRPSPLFLRIALNQFLIDITTN